MLTKSQIRNLHLLDTATKVEIMHECAESLGVVSVDEYCKVMGGGRRTVYVKIQNGDIKTISIADRKFPMINA